MIASDDSNKQTHKVPISSPQPQHQSITNTLKGGCLFLFILFTLISVIVYFLVIKPDLDQKNKNIKQGIAEIIKIAPSVTHKETLTGLDFYVTCNDNYSYVKLIISFKDNNGNIIKTETLTGYNYQKGNTYILSYKIDSLSSLIDAFKSPKFSYDIKFE